MTVNTIPVTFALTDLVPGDDGEPRIRDLVLAERLGMASPRTIRTVIKDNADELMGFGPLMALPSMVDIGSGAKREVLEFLLTEEQALTVCFLSRTSRAVEVRRGVIRVFVAWRHGRLATVVPAQPLEPAITIPMLEYIELLKAKTRLLEGKPAKDRQKPRPMTAADRAEVLRLHALGWSKSRICRHLRRSTATIWPILKEAAHG